MAAIPDDTPSSFPLLWDVLPSQKHDLEDYDNLTLNVDGKGIYLPSLDGPALPSHRLDLPFPLRSAIIGADYRQEQGNGSSPLDGAALPLLAGDLGTDSDHDPVKADVSKYWMYCRVAQFALVPPPSGKSRKSSQPGKPGRRYMPLERRGLTREAMCDMLDKLKGTASTLPVATHQLHSALPLVHFLTKNPVFKGWDEKHNWLYAGGSVALLSRSQRLLHTSGRDVAVAELNWRSHSSEDGPQLSSDEDPSSQFTLQAEDEALLTWPDKETVLQIHAADAKREVAAVRSLSTGRFYVRVRRRLTCADQLSSREAVSAVCCLPQLPRRWALVDTAGHLTVRHSVHGASVLSAQLPEVERPTGWFGLAPPSSQPHQLLAASWERLYTVDLRAPEPTVLFRLSANGRLFSPSDRLHAVRGSALRPHLSLLTSSRHLVVVDLRQPRTAWLSARLMVPPAPVYLDACQAAGGGDRELVTVGSQDDQHVQALVFDWSAGAELGASRLLGCARPPVEALGGPGMESRRRLGLSLAGLAVDRPAAGRNHVYTTNSCGDVFVHPLVPADPGEEDGGDGDGSGEGRRDVRAGSEPLKEWRDSETSHGRRESVEGQTDAKARSARRQCQHLVTAWRDTVEEQRHQRARATALRCEVVSRWSGNLTDLLGPPPSESAAAEGGGSPRWCPPAPGDPSTPAPEKTPQRVRRWLRRTPGTVGPGRPEDTPEPEPEEPDEPDGTPAPAEDRSDGDSRLTEPGGETPRRVDASSTDVSTPNQSEIEELLMEWDSEGDDSETDGGVSVTEELAASSLRIPGSERRSRVPRWQRRRRRHSSGSSHVSSSRPASRTSSRPASRASSRASSPASAGGGSDSVSAAASAARPAASLVTPARPLAAVSQARQPSAFQQFSLDLFDD